MIATDFVESRPAEALAGRGRGLRCALHRGRIRTEKRPLKGALVGSTPYRLIHLTERPVIVVRGPGRLTNGASIASRGEPLVRCACMSFVLDLRLLLLPLRGE